MVVTRKGNRWRNPSPSGGFCNFMDVIKSKISLLLWGIVIISSFIFLPFLWALFSLFYIAAISPIIAMFIYAPFKGLLDKHSDILKSRFSGFSEAVALIIVYYLVSFRFDIPFNFIPMTAAIFTVTQVGRYYRSGDFREANQLIWFLITAGIWFVAQFLV